eukprot:scaffold6042_cov247-Ochromonas_danica.AAC.1
MIFNSYFLFTSELLASLHQLPKFINGAIDENGSIFSHTMQSDCGKRGTELEGNLNIVLFQQGLKLLHIILRLDEFLSELSLDFLLRDSSEGIGYYRSLRRVVIIQDRSERGPGVGKGCVASSPIGFPSLPSHTPGKSFICYLGAVLAWCVRRRGPIPLKATRETPKPVFHTFATKMLLGLV